MSKHGAALADAGPLTAPRGRPRAVRRAALLAGSAGTLAVGLTVGLTAFGGDASPAYAVTQHPDGTITVAVTRTSGIAGANSTLRSLNERVVVVPEGAGCPSLGSLHAPAKEISGPGAPPPGRAPALPPPNLTIDKESATVNARSIPAGDLLVVAVSSTEHGISVSAAMTRPPAPSCVSVPQTQPGNGNTAQDRNGSGSPVRGNSGSGNTVHDKNGSGGSAPAKVSPQGGGQSVNKANG